MTLRLRLLLTMFVIGLPLTGLFWWFGVTLQNRMEEDKQAQFIVVFMKNRGRAACEASPENWNGSLFRDFMPDFHHRPPPDRNESSEWMPPPGFSSPDFDPSDRPRPPEPKHFDRGPMGPPPDMDQWGPPGKGPRGRPPSMPRLYAYDAQLHSSNSSAPSLSEDLLDDFDSASTGHVLADDLRDEDGERMLVKMPWDEGPCVYILAHKMVPRPFISWEPTNPRFLIWLLPILSAIVALLLTIGPVVSRVRQLTKEVGASEAARYSPEITVKGKDEVGRLAQAFKDAANEIRVYIESQERRERTLRDFLENTTHDVMIPLTVLQGHLSTLNEKHPEDDEDAEIIESAIHESNYMASLIHNLAVAAKLEAGEPKAQWGNVNLNGILERILLRQRPVAVQHNVSLDSAVPDVKLAVRGDVTFIEQAVTNVVYNAIRHNQPGGHVAMILETMDDNRFNVRVIDDGPGIPEEERQRLVERFYRGNAARTRDPGGHGLGLNIAYQIVKLHGWSLELNDSEYGGLQVDISGPLLVETDDSTTS